MTHTHLSHLTNEELLRHADNERDPLTTTEVELELAARLQRLVDEPPLPSDLRKSLDDTGIEEEHLPALIALLDEHGAGDPERLAKKLKCAVDFQALADDAGDVFSRLCDLTNATT